MQLTRSRKIIGGLALAGTMALSGIVGFAQQGTTQEGAQGGGKDRGSWGRGERGGHKKGMRRGGAFGGRFAEKLNLTDAQKAQMEQITARYRETAKAGRQQRQGRGERGFDAFGGGTFNESEVRAAAQARANAQVER
ncbi:MAG TPA: Spy/CpxP family protein refolding chaperone, partial [Pyrinomonadaceae bacterium]|nr:Spy/CpxP family protein refolding chaperone [Pyrinomonadaceae bacterium]